MASTKISALPGASTLTGAETIPVVQGGVTKKVTTDQFLTKDASGNVGLGVTPSAWTMKALDVSNSGSFYGDGVVSSWVAGISQNAYFDGAWKYRHDGHTAERYEIGAGHKWYTAPGGTAGNAISFTQAMTLDDASGNLTPGGDNTQNLGSGALRWSTVYAGTGTINTSDAREKTEVRFMAADEIEAAKELSKEIGIYQFLDSVAKKGDKARHHVGLTVQRAIELMKLHGLDPFAYGFICFDKWDDVVVEHPAVEAKAATEAKDEVVDAEGNVIEAAVEAQAAIEAKDAWTEVTLKAGDRYSFRYDQLNLFIARGIEARLAALEAKRWTR